MYVYIHVYIAMPPTLLLIQNSAVRNLPTGLVGGVVKWNDPLVAVSEQKG